MENLIETSGGLKERSCGINKAFWCILTKNWLKGYLNHANVKKNLGISNRDGRTLTW